MATQKPKTRPLPIRRCAACGKQDAKGTLLRIARSPQGQVTLDLKGKAPGRGAYLCPTPSCVEAGLRRGRLERTLKVQLMPQDRTKLISDIQQAAAHPTLAESRSTPPG